MPREIHVLVRPAIEHVQLAVLVEDAAGTRLATLALTAADERVVRTTTRRAGHGDPDGLDGTLGPLDDDLVIDRAGTRPGSGADRLRGADRVLVTTQCI